MPRARRSRCHATRCTVRSASDVDPAWVGARDACDVDRLGGSEVDQATIARAREPGTTWWCYAGGYDDDDCARTQAQCLRSHKQCKEQKQANLYLWGNNGEVIGFNAFRTSTGCEAARRTYLTGKPFLPSNVRMVTPCKRIGARKHPAPNVATGTGFSCFAFIIGDSLRGSQCNRTDPEKCKRREQVTANLPSTKITTSCARRDTAFALQSWKSTDEAMLFIDAETCESRRKTGASWGPCTSVK